MKSRKATDDGPFGKGGTNPFVQEQAESEAELKTVLSAAQFQRLEQISRQLRGIGAFSDPEVIAALGLTRDQKMAAQDLQAQVSDAMHGRPVIGPGGDHRSVVQHGATVKFVSSLLRRKQRIWDGLTGTQYHGSAPERNASSQFEPPPFGMGGHGLHDDHGPGPHGFDQPPHERPSMDDQQ